MVVKLIRFFMLISCLVLSRCTADGAIIVSAPQSGFSGFSSSPIPVGTLDFTGISPFTVQSLSWTFTIFDGDTGPGDFDFNDVSIGLDGIDTGILLNGFLDDQTITRTINGNLIGALATNVTNAIFTDNLLNVTLIDRTPNDNFWELPSSSRFEIAFFDIPDGGVNGGVVPEPASMATILGLSIGMVLFRRIRASKSSREVS